MDIVEVWQTSVCTGVDLESASQLTAGAIDQVCVARTNPATQLGKYNSDVGLIFIRQKSPNNEVACSEVCYTSHISTVMSRSIMASSFQKWS